MNLYKAKVTGPISWDEYDGFVVRAESEEAARALVIATYQSELHYNRQSFSDSNYLEIVLLPTEGPPSIVLHSFNAG